MKSIDFSLDNFKGIINQTKFVVENQKKKYSNLKHKFLELNISYKKDSENLINDFLDIEKKNYQILFVDKKS